MSICGIFPEHNHRVVRGTAVYTVAPIESRTP